MQSCMHPYPSGGDLVFSKGHKEPKLVFLEMND